MSSGTSVEKPDSLRKAGAGATEIAGRTQTVGNHPVDETRSAAKDFGAGEWDGGLGGALGNLAEVWSGQVSALVASCRDLGVRFDTTGGNYVQVETANTENVKSARSSPFG